MILQLLTDHSAAGEREQPRQERKIYAYGVGKGAANQC